MKKPAKKAKKKKIEAPAQFAILEGERDPWGDINWEFSWMNDGQNQEEILADFKRYTDNTQATHKYEKHDDGRKDPDYYAVVEIKLLDKVVKINKKK